MALTRRVRLTVGAMAVAATATGIAWACMNISFAPQFKDTRRPYRSSLERQSFLEGKLGIIEGSFLHVELFTAYRYLNGLPLNEEQRLALTRGTVPTEAQEDSARSKWEEALENVADAAPRNALRASFSDRIRKVHPDQWQYFLNCRDDAFRTAAKTLADRIERFGADSREVGFWLEGQRTVFSNCGGGAAIPEEDAGGLDPIIQFDRAYQVAAAHFYAQHYEEAARRFKEISADAASPWQPWGAYLAARSYIRQGTLGGSPGQRFDRTSLEKAAEMLREILADPSLSDRHNSARGLLEFVRLRIAPNERLEELSSILLSSQAHPEFGRQAWIDYDYLIDRGHRLESDDPLWEWMRIMRGLPGRRSDAISKWKGTGETAWLVAAMVAASGDDPAAAQLLDASAEVLPSDPAYDTILYHRCRLLVETGREGEAVQLLDEILAGPETLRNTRNRFLELRFALADNLDDLLEYAPRRPLSYGFWGVDAEQEWYLNQDALQVFNAGLPLRSLERAVESTRLPLNIRKELALAAWCRALLIGDDQTARRLHARVVEFWPELLQESASIADPEAKARGFQIALFLLRHPGIQPHLRASLHRRVPLDEIDSFRENWWCSLKPELTMHEAGYIKRAQLRYRSSRDRSSESTGLFPPAFLSREEKAALTREMSRLHAVPAAPSYLTEQILSWARLRPNDPRVPEAVHLAVRSTRLGCEDEQSSEYSRKAFQFLHRNYPNDPWTKATPYWY